MSHWFFLFFLMVGPALLFPGDVWWINDEPLLIQAALARNASGSWWEPGLSGPTGNLYGPIPIFIYQVLLKLTTDLEVLVLIKTFFTFLLVLGSFHCVVKWMRVPLHACCLLLFSPYLYSYSRSLWDNCFLVPVTAVWHTAYLEYAREGKRSSLILWAIMGFVALHIHLMSLIVMLSMVLGFLYFEKHHWRRHLGFAFGLGLLVIIASLPYLRVLLSTGGTSSYRERVHFFEALLSAFAGARVLTFAQFIDYFIPGVKNIFFGKIYWLLSWVSLVGYVFLMKGFLEVTKIRKGKPLSAESRFGYLLCLELLITCCVFFWMKMALEPHYSNATWFAYWLLMAVGFREMKPIYSKAFVTLMGVLWFSLVLLLRIQGGDRGPHFGPVLGEQIRFAKQLTKTCMDDGLKVNAEPIQYYPQAIRTLCKIYGKSEILQKYPLELRYRDLTGWTAWLELK